MDFKSENEVVNETLIYSQIAAQYALKRFQDATNTIEDDYWWSAYDYQEKEFEEYRDYLLDDEIADFIIEIVLSPASYLPRKTFMQFVLSKSQQKYQRVATYEY